jgi:curved DNA-binding protein CbpA
VSARDYYDVLGVGRDASSADIENAYAALSRRLAAQNDPAARSKTMRELYEARAVLSKPELRQRYDHGGLAALSDTSVRFETHGKNATKHFQSNQDNFYSSLFGSNAKSNSTQAPSSIKTKMPPPHIGSQQISKAEFERLIAVLSRSISLRQAPAEQLRQLQASMLGRDQQGNLWTVGITSRQWNRRDAQGNWTRGQPPDHLSIPDGVRSRLIALERAAPPAAAPGMSSQPHAAKAVPHMPPSDAAETRRASGKGRWIVIALLIAAVYYFGWGDGRQYLAQVVPMAQTPQPQATAPQLGAPVVTSGQGSPSPSAPSQQKLLDEIFGGSSAQSSAGATDTSTPTAPSTAQDQFFQELFAGSGNAPSTHAAPPPREMNPEMEAVQNYVEQEIQEAARDAASQAASSQESGPTGPSGYFPSETPEGNRSLPTN